MLPVVQYIEGKAGFHQGGKSPRTKKSVVDVKEVTMQKLFCLQTHSEKDVLSQPLSSSFNFQFTIIFQGTGAIINTNSFSRLCADLCIFTLCSKRNWTIYSFFRLICWPSPFCADKRYQSYNEVINLKSRFFHHFPLNTLNGPSPHKNSKRSKKLIYLHKIPL